MRYTRRDALLRGSYFDAIRSWTVCNPLTAVIKPRKKTSDNVMPNVLGRTCRITTRWRVSRRSGLRPRWRGSLPQHDYLANKPNTSASSTLWIVVQRRISGIPLTRTNSLFHLVPNGHSTSQRRQPSMKLYAMAISQSLDYAWKILRVLSTDSTKEASICRLFIWLLYTLMLRLRSFY